MIFQYLGRQVRIINFIDDITYVQDYLIKKQETLCGVAVFFLQKKLSLPKMK